MTKAFHNLMPLALVAAIVGGLWTYASAKTKVDQAAQGYWPALSPMPTSVLLEAQSQSESTIEEPTPGPLSWSGAERIADPLLEP